MNNKFEINCPPVFNLGLTLDCGQAFRWEEIDGKWHGVAFGKPLIIEQIENKIIFDCDEKDFNEIWKKYFDFDCDYEKIVNGYDDKYLKEAVQQFNGIRILRQEPWETLCSFIISQRNSIPKIKKVVRLLCEYFGEGESGLKSFPSAQVIANLTKEDLAPLKMGYRDEYIIDAAKKVVSGEIDFDRIYSEPIEYGRQELLKIKGVGVKVAECTLLFGFHKTEAFPIDTWIKKIMEECYPNGLPACTKGTEGIAQQYLFHWRRMRG